MVSKLSTPEEAVRYRVITDAVHAADPDVTLCLQILHSGPLARTPDCVGPSAVKSRIGASVPRDVEKLALNSRLPASPTALHSPGPRAMTASELEWDSFTRANMIKLFWGVRNGTSI
jgi:2,4-dienoyl-CoA reductase-like NADH-dependent reductase (Old Yellow Enzyme family)